MAGAPPAGRASLEAGGELDAAAAIRGPRAASWTGSARGVARDRGQAWVAERIRRAGDSALAHRPLPRPRRPAPSPLERRRALGAAPARPRALERLRRRAAAAPTTSPPSRRPDRSRPLDRDILAAALDRRRRRSVAFRSPSTPSCATWSASSSAPMLEVSHRPPDGRRTSATAAVRTRSDAAKRSTAWPLPRVGQLRSSRSALARTGLRRGPGSRLRTSGPAASRTATDSVRQPSDRRPEAALDQLEEDHLGRVRAARAELDDPRVAAGARRVARRDLLEQLVDDELVLAERRERLAAGMQVAALGERDQLLDLGLDRLRLRLGGLDPLVLDQLLGRFVSSDLRCAESRLSLLRFLPWRIWSSPLPLSPSLSRRAGRGRGRAGSR